MQMHVESIGLSAHHHLNRRNPHLPHSLVSSILSTLSFFLLLATSLSAQAVFTTPGQFSVGQGGEASYTIPIQVPPGTAGMAPSLSLSYSSSGGNGTLGMGWGIQGLSQISRCPQTLVQDNQIRGVNYDNNDKYCLDGQRLISTSNTYGTDGTEYRTEQANFAKIISYGTAGNGPAWFKVWTKGGQILEYGNTADSRIEAAGIATVRTWGVNKISDTLGNYLTVTYTEDNPNGEAYVSRIDYTGNANSTPALTPYANVQFIYEPRPDISTGYQAGSVIKSTQRLIDIKTYINANTTPTLVKDYKLTYEQSASTQRSRLKTLTECDGSATAQSCHKPVGLAWGEGGTGFATVWNDSVSGWSDNIRDLVMDVNGDGKSDLVRIWQNAGLAYAQVSISTGTGFATVWNDSVSGWSDNIRDLVMDVNGDGKSDLVRIWQNAGLAYAQVSISTGTGFATVWNDSVSGWSDNIRDLVMDVNGDGKSDLVRIWQNAGLAYAQVSISTGTGFATVWNDSVSGWSDNIRDLVMDVNGDGKSDLVRIWQNAGLAYAQVSISTGTGFATVWNDSVSGWSDNIRDLVMDVNGDGKSDLVRIWQNAGLAYAQVSISTGTGFATVWNDSVSGWSDNIRDLVMDVNGDGKSDLVRIWQNAGLAYAQVSISTGTGFATVWNDSVSGWSDNIRDLVMDVNGDGKSDLVRLWKYGDLAYAQAGLSSGYFPDLLKTLTPGLGTITSIVYKPITDGSVYTKDSGSNASVYPIVDIQAPMYVVSSVTSSDGIGGNVTTNYTYGGLKAQMTGRGSLGFRWMKTATPDTDTYVSSFYRQDYPYTGLPSQTENHLISNNNLLAASQQTYANRPITMGNAVSQFPYVGQTVEQHYELDGSLVSTTTTTNQYDNYGNITQIKVDDGTGNTKTTNNTYNNDTARWLLGRLLRSNVTAVNATPLPTLPTPQQIWANCASEGGTCTFTGTTTVRYGANGTYNTGTYTNSVACINNVFGDPTPNVAKTCDYLTNYASPPLPTWTNCASEGGTCTFTGTYPVRYGANGIYNTGTYTNSVACTNATFGDPTPYVGKTCDVLK